MNKICIELHTDNNYVVPTIITLTSLFKNKNKDSVYEVRVLGNRLTQENIKLLEKVLDGYGKVIPHESSLSKFEGTHPHVSSTDLFKFDLPDVLSDWDKVLYIDTDMIIQGDLSELFNTELGGHYIAAVKDMAGMLLEKHHERLGLKNYFNAGMMLMNLKKMRADNITEKLIDYKLHKDVGHFMSQDTLNAVFYEQVMWLNPKYNWMAANQTGFTAEEVNKFYDIVENLNLKNTVIVHLTNKKKPWDYADAWGHDLWVKYYRKSILKHVKRHYKLNHKLLGRLLKKTRSANGRRRIYFCGVKVFSYKRKNKRLVVPCCCIGNPDIIAQNHILLPHPVGIVISKSAILGKNCIIYQNVTIGSRDFATGDMHPSHYPVIGDNVTIYAGAAVIGPVHIGNNAVIGANAVVLNDVPENALAVGVPAQIKKKPAK